MRKKAFLLLCVMAASLFLTACYDAVEIGDNAYVSTLGIERGVNDKYRISFQIPKFDQASSGGGGGGGAGGGESKEEKDTITVDAPAFFEAVALANTTIPKRLNFMHLKAIVISEDLAKSGLLGEFLAPLIRYREIRRSTNIIVCKGTAMDFLAASKPYMGSLVTKTYEDLIGNFRTTGFFPNVTLNDLTTAMKSTVQESFAIYGAVNNGDKFKANGPVYTGKFNITGDYYAGDVPRKGGPEIELMGTAVSNGDIMVGKLNGFETQMMLILRGELKKAIFAIPDPERTGLSIAIEIKEFERPVTKIDIKGDKIKINSHLSMEGEIVGIPSRINYEEPNKKKIVEKAMADYLENGLNRTVQKCQGFNTDVFHYGEIAVRQFPTIQEWDKFNWLSKFGNAEVKVSVDFTVRRTGTMIKSSHVISSKGVEK
ncbi:MAG: Ger(x)C family spore germination protein [Clostridia bacterium]|nr:Ger(x)C family spore germination protein [Clostridia bacterium]